MKNNKRKTMAKVWQSTIMARGNSLFESPRLRRSD